MSLTRQIERARVLKLRREYGITVDVYDAMLHAQDGRCFLCGIRPQGKRLAVDHCHKTGRVRGLLCSSCNQELGAVEKWLLNKSITWLSKAQEYILREEDWRNAVQEAPAE